MKRKICIIGSGSFATALGNRLVQNLKNDVTLLSIEEDVIQSINESHVNYRYFPQMILSKKLKATGDKKILSDAEVIFIAIPSYVAVDYMVQHAHLLQKDALVINLAKGFGKDRKLTIAESLNKSIDNEVCTLKGPSFAREVLNNIPTAMTLGAESKKTYKKVLSIFKNTRFIIDFSDDMVGVELLSILKNIYAIAIGIVDAHFNSPNIKFLVLTKAFNEMHQVLLDNHRNQDTIFKYCGYGDFALTALNDLSRNRTLGLLIGKGYFSEDLSSKVLLEGQIAVKVFCEERNSIALVRKKYPIIAELYKIFSEEKYDSSDFVWKIVK